MKFMQLVCSAVLYFNGIDKTNTPSTCQDLRDVRVAIDKLSGVTGYKDNTTIAGLAKQYDVLGCKKECDAVLVSVDKIAGAIDARENSFYIDAPVDTEKEPSLEVALRKRSFYQSIIPAYNSARFDHQTQDVKTMTGCTVFHPQFEQDLTVSLVKFDQATANERYKKFLQESDDRKN